MANRFSSNTLVTANQHIFIYSTLFRHSTTAEKSNTQTNKKRKLGTNTVRSNHSVHVWLS